MAWLHRNSSNFRITISWNYNPQSTNRYLQFSVNGWNQQLSLVGLLSQDIFYENQTWQNWPSPAFHQLANHQKCNLEAAAVRARDAKPFPRPLPPGP